MPRTEPSTRRPRAGSKRTRGTTAAPKSPEVFSPAGSSLFLRANAALNRIANGVRRRTETETETATADGQRPGTGRIGAGRSCRTDRHRASRHRASRCTTVRRRPGQPKPEPRRVRPRRRPEGTAAEEGEAEGKPEAVGGHERAAAEAKPSPSSPAQAPPADAFDVAPERGSRGPDDPRRPRTAHAPGPPDAAPRARPGPRRSRSKPVKPVKPAPSPGTSPCRPRWPSYRPRPCGARGRGRIRLLRYEGRGVRGRLEAVQNEDLADVVGEEALALHKAEAEAEFKPADEDSRRRQPGHRPDRARRDGADRRGGAAAARLS